MKDINIPKELFKKYNQGNCSPEEKELVESWYLNEMLLNQDDLESPNYIAAKKEIWNRIAEKRPVKSKLTSLRPLWTAAASIVLILGIGIIFYQKKNHPIKQASMIQPGGNKAILTLSNGKKINLTDAAKGEIVAQTGLKITITAAGQLIYKVDPTLAENTKANGYNTITTPAGGQYQIELNDGTKVWLNSMSSLRYPLNFKGANRIVELDGEAYFEVSHIKGKTFKVVSEKQTISVLGTHFNVNTYRNEPDFKTTLLEGSVRVSNQNHQSRILKPGEQAQVTDKGISVQPVDTDQAVAWHNGDMTFDGAKLSTIMRQVSRWYDVEIIYQGNIEEVEFGGSISRNKSIHEVLKVLESTQGVKFKLEGRRLIVMP